MKIKGVPHYLYRALDSKGQNNRFYALRRRNTIVAKLFFKKLFKSPHAVKPRVINVDKNKAYPSAVNLLKKKKELKFNFELRQVKYLNNIIEQDHRFIKKLVKSGLGFKSFISAENTLEGYETMHMIKKNQINGITKNDIIKQNEFIELIFGISV